MVKRSRHQAFCFFAAAAVAAAGLRAAAQDAEIVDAEMIPLRADGAPEVIVRLEPQPRCVMGDLNAMMLDAAQAGITPSLQREAMAVDWSLHSTLAGALDNDSARAIYARNRDRISVIQHFRPPLPDRIVPAMEEHLAILDAIEAGDEEGAARKVREHFQQTLRWWGILA